MCHVQHLALLYPFHRWESRTWPRSHVPSKWQGTDPLSCKSCLLSIPHCSLFPTFFANYIIGVSYSVDVSDLLLNGQGALLPGSLWRKRVQSEPLVNIPYNKSLPHCTLLWNREPPALRLRYLRDKPYAWVTMGNKVRTWRRKGFRTWPLEKASFWEEPNFFLGLSWPGIGSRLLSILPAKAGSALQSLAYLLTKFLVLENHLEMKYGSRGRTVVSQQTPKDCPNPLSTVGFL